MGRDTGLDEPSHPEELQRLFESLDIDRNGRLDAAEVQAALRLLGLPAGKHYLSDLYQQYDKDRSEEIDYEEFKRYVEAKEAGLQRVFRTIDADGDQGLDAGEVRRAAAVLGLSVAPEEAERMVALLDADADGRISYAEFRRFCVLLPDTQISQTHIISAWADSASWVASMEYRLGHVPPSQGLERLMAGGVAGAVSRTVVAPLERCRSIMMADRSATRLMPVLRRMWADGGPRGLFRGNLVTVVKTFPSSAIQFAAYDLCKEVLRAYSGPGVAELSSGQQLLAGSVAGAAACSATYPLESLRTQISVAQGKSASYWGILRGMVAERGLAGLYQGYSAGLVKDSASNALGFASYELFCRAYQRYRGEHPSAGAKGVLGGAAAFATMAATMPLENVMRRLQVQGRPGFPRRYTGPIDCAARMAREEGLRAFWRGSLSSFAKVVPSIAATRVLYEAIVELRGIGGVRRYRSSADQE